MIGTEIEITADNLDARLPGEVCPSNPVKYAAVQALLTACGRRVLVTVGYEDATLRSRPYKPPQHTSGGY